MVTEMERKAAPTVSINRGMEGLTPKIRGPGLAERAEISIHLVPGLPELALDKIVSIPKLDPLALPLLSVST